MSESDSEQKITSGKVVQLKYSAFEKEVPGQDKALEMHDMVFYLHGGHGSIFAKAEEALEGHVAGDKVQVSLTPEEGYGERDESMVITAPAEDFPPQAQEIGAGLEAHGPDGEVVSFVVTQIANGQITVDGNHGMAGKDLNLMLEVVAVRDATEQELKVGDALPTMDAGNDEAIH